jgi:hypothetical protein
MKREAIPEINLGAFPEERFGELFTEADEREAEEILAKPEEERQRIINARVAALLEKMHQRSHSKRNDYAGRLRHGEQEVDTGVPRDPYHECDTA